MMVMREETMDRLAEEIGRLTRLNAELLAALRMMLDATIEHPGFSGEATLWAEAAIAKAEFMANPGSYFTEP